MLIREGYSLIAAIFNLFWAMYHRMWLVSATVIILQIMFFSFEMPKFNYLFHIDVLLIFGFFASDLREYYALKRGLALSEIIIANDEEEAEWKYYNYKYHNQALRT